MGQCFSVFWLWSRPTTDRYDEEHGIVQLPMNPLPRKPEPRVDSTIPGSPASKGSSVQGVHSVPSISSDPSVPRPIPTSPIFFIASSSSSPMEYGDETTEDTKHHTPIASRVADEQPHAPIPPRVVRPVISNKNSRSVPVSISNSKPSSRPTSIGRLTEKKILTSPTQEVYTSEDIQGENGALCLKLRRLEVSLRTGSLARSKSAVSLRLSDPADRAAAPTKPEQKASSDHPRAFSLDLPKSGPEGSVAPVTKPKRDKVKLHEIPYTDICFPSEPDANEQLPAIV
ncbi:hypothetical protein B0T25DRAFT_229491 [Lasiosphaeria hispida]|uniref:Uncharacterized protein n=1 Tax=Lasiosphaeria hispida TaxID=260671 RepID=A0AAJ0MBN7_9PEZI|nr:hypothetical protein B0T25DRAFT_229491 [Lasiosphaeria hispida]